MWFRRITDAIKQDLKVFNIMSAIDSGKVVTYREFRAYKKGNKFYLERSYHTVEEYNTKESLGVIMDSIAPIHEWNI